MRMTELLDSGWKFHRGEALAPDGTPIDHQAVGWMKSGGFKQGPPAFGFDDSAWRDVELPHDFVVEGEFTPCARAVSGGGLVDSMRSEDDNQHCFHGSLAGGVAWYRRRFHVPESGVGKHFSLRFDGVYRDCSVFLNEHFLGDNLSGYCGFVLEIGDFLNYGGENVLAVRVDATHHEGWFYEGGGLYRHVWLVEASPLRIASEGGVFVTSTPDDELSPAWAEIKVQTRLVNQLLAGQRLTLAQRVLDGVGRELCSCSAQVEAPWLEERSCRQTMSLPRPELWDVDHPRLYRLVTELCLDGVVVDHVQTTFGIRTLRFDPDRGFYLNGRPLKLKGVCCHQDHAGLGSALPDSVHRFRIERLKRMGCNAYRCAHHPPAPELLDACDQLGMLVIDENRYLSSAKEFLGQLSRMVMRDRNHPSVILWSIGNEEMTIQGTPLAGRVAASMAMALRTLDSSRPVTYANNNAGTWGKGVSVEVDVLGCNYIHTGYWNDGSGKKVYNDFYQEFHLSHPRKPMLVTEAASTLTTRGVYAKDDARCHMPAYDTCFPEWGCSAETMWVEVAAKDYLAGAFVWTGFDYKGEPVPFKWPCVGSHFGIMDACGFPKDNYYYYLAWWGAAQVLHLLPHWTWTGREGEPIDVRCFSNCDEVELLLNGVSLGRKAMPRYRHLAWTVAYQPGELLARGYQGGLETARCVVETAGAPVALRLTPQLAVTASGDAIPVMAEVVDAQGRLVPTADNEVEFSVEGDGRVLGVGNGDPSSHEPDKATRRRAFNGLAQAIVRGRGAIVAASPGLASVRCRIGSPP